MELIFVSSPANCNFNRKNLLRYLSENLLTFSISNYYTLFMFQKRWVWIWWKLIINSKVTNLGIALESLFWTLKQVSSISECFYCYLEHAFVCQFGWIDFNILFPEMEYLFVYNYFSNNYSSNLSKIPVMLLAIFSDFIFGFEQVFV